MFLLYDYYNRFAFFKKTRGRQWKLQQQFDKILSILHNSRNSLGKKSKRSNVFVLFFVFCFLFLFLFFFSLHEDLLKDIRNYTEYHRYQRVGSKNLGLTANFGRFLASNIKSFETSLCAVDLSYGSLIMIKLNNLICADDYF